MRAAARAAGATGATGLRTTVLHVARDSPGGSVGSGHQRGRFTGRTMKGGWTAFFWKILVWLGNKLLLKRASKFAVVRDMVEYIVYYLLYIYILYKITWSPGGSVKRVEMGAITLGVCLISRSRFAICEEGSQADGCAAVSNGLLLRQTVIYIKHRRSCAVRIPPGLITLADPCSPPEPDRVVSARPDPRPDVGERWAAAAHGPQGHKAAGRLSQGRLEMVSLLHPSLLQFAAFVRLHCTGGEGCRSQVG